jgi:ABC-type nickel/cobalt efflux system permease component RcnA
MHTRLTLFIIVALAILSAAQLSSVTLTVSPRSATSAELWLFFVSLFVLLSTGIGLIWHAARRLRAKRGGKPVLLTSIRQAGLLSLVVVLSLFFNTLGIFQFWDIIPLVLAAVLIEFFFQAEKKPHATLTYDQTES